jgi:hypothetical protein
MPDYQVDALIRFVIALRTIRGTGRRVTLADHADIEQEDGMSFPYYADVEQAHADLVAEGLIKTRYTQEEVEQDKGLLTRRAGYYVSTRHDPTIGLLEKTTGNNSLGYSVDLLLRRIDGTFWDIATDQAGDALPLNGGPGGPDPELIPRWRAPTAELAQIDGDGGGQDLTALAPPYDEDKSVQFGMACNDAYIESDATPDGGMIAVHAMRCAYDYYVAGLPWDACYTKHVDAFRAEYGLPPLAGAARASASARGREPRRR